MTQSTAPKMTSVKVKYAAMLLGVLAVAATPLAFPASATAERVWDIEDYDNCVADPTGSQLDLSINDQRAFHAYCCNRSGGVFIDDGYLGKCVAPPAEPASGSRQLPGNAQIPSDIATAPTVTKVPPRPIQVPSDIATVSTLSQAPA
jgi:hypothetical protein